jgi:hypothetical protein
MNDLEGYIGYNGSASLANYFEFIDYSGDLTGSVF